MFWLPFFLSIHFDPQSANVISSLYSVGMMPGGVRALAALDRSIASCIRMRPPLGRPKTSILCSLSLARALSLLRNPVHCALTRGARRR